MTGASSWPRHHFHVARCSKQRLSQGFCFTFYLFLRFMNLPRSKTLRGFCHQTRFSILRSSTSVASLQRTPSNERSTESSFNVPTLQLSGDRSSVWRSDVKSNSRKSEWKTSKVKSLPWFAPVQLCICGKMFLNVGGAFRFPFATLLLVFILFISLKSSGNADCTQFLLHIIY